MDLDGVRANNECMLAFSDAFQQLGNAVTERRPTENCWAVPLGHPEQPYMWPRRIRKQMNKAQREHDAGDFSCDVADSLERSLELLTHVETMHQARWTDRGISGCFSTKQFGDFLRQAVGAFWHDGQSQRPFVTVLKWQGIPAAGSISFRSGSTLAVYLAGMNPEHAAHKPGWKLNWFNVRHAKQLGCTTLDFLRGDEEYKQWMGAEPTAQQRWLIAAPRWSSQVRSAVYRTARTIKHQWLNKPRLATLVEPAVDE
jgi:CelD/BcsL family acetyltransferase involved in cellulose biosynthesis